MSTARKITAALAVLGVLLLGLHLVGRFVPLRHPGVYTELRHFPDDITLTYAEAKAQLARRPGEAPLDYAVRATHVVNRGVAHYWRDEGAERYHMHVPPWENYVLWALGLFDPAGYGKWEFGDADKGLERGVGLCSQHAVILTDALERGGVRSAIVGLGEHIVALVGEPPDRYLLLDPDYGVVVPHGILEVQSNPGLVRPYYRAAGYKPAQVDRLVAIYGPADNVLYPNGPNAYTYGRRYRERLFYAACWVIPLLLMAPYATGVAIRARRRRRKAPPG